MKTDLAVTAVIGACVLAAIAATAAWLGRSISAGTLPLGGRLALRPGGVPRTPEALLAVNRAAAPFMRHYALIVGALALVVIVLAPFSDVAAVVVHLVAIAMLCLGVWVCWTKARRAASTAPAATPQARSAGAPSATLERTDDLTDGTAGDTAGAVDDTPEVTDAPRPER